MAKTLIAILVLLSLATPAFAQQPSPAAQNTHVGRTKMLWGAGLIIAGAFVMPVTSFGEGSRIRNQGDNPAVGMSLIGGGTALIVWGMRDRYKAANPQIAIGVSATRSKAVFVRRSW